MKKAFWLLIILAILVGGGVSVWWNLATSPKGSRATMDTKMVCRCKCGDISYDSDNLENCDKNEKSACEDYFEESDRQKKSDNSSVCKIVAIPYTESAGAE